VPSYRGTAVPSCYRHGVKRPGDVILGVIAATATALLLALIARDAVGMPADMVRDDALFAAGFILAAVSLSSLLKWLRS
jgi:hypothetical protein